MEEKIMFQFVMNYKAYRRAMIAKRAAAAVAVAGGLAALCVISIPIGIVLPIAALIVGAISILVSLGTERTYTVYNTRIVFKRRNNDKRVSVPLENIKSVGYRRAFYEKDLGTGTVTIVAVNDKGAKKKYRMSHVFDVKPCLEFIEENMGKRIDGAEDREDRGNV